jgi:hypothetical protein
LFDKYDVFFLLSILQHNKKIDFLSVKKTYNYL